VDLSADFWYRSFKELSKALNAHIPTVSLPLPDDLIQVIQAYLDKHYPIEDSDSQRLQDELLSIYQRDVKNFPSRYSIFIAILRLLRPAISGSARIMQWWETLILPALEYLAEGKGLVFEYRGILLDILVYDTDGEQKSHDANTSALLSEKLLELWLYKSSTINSEGGSAAQYLEDQVKQILIEFGKKRPKVLTNCGLVNPLILVGFPYGPRQGFCQEGFSSRDINASLRIHSTRAATSSSAAPDSFVR
jgi:solute carrier family 25 (mitochondrial carrier protein), member 16